MNSQKQNLIQYLTLQKDEEQNSQGALAAI